MVWDELPFAIKEKASTPEIILIQIRPEAFFLTTRYFLSVFSCFLNYLSTNHSILSLNKMSVIPIISDDILQDSVIVFPCIFDTKYDQLTLHRCKDLSIRSDDVIKALILQTKCWWSTYSDNWVTVNSPLCGNELDNCFVYAF